MKVSMMKVQHAPVWRYLYTRRFENDASLKALRAFQTAELHFLFGNFNPVSPPNLGVDYAPTPDELAFSNALMGREPCPIAQEREIFHQQLIYFCGKYYMSKASNCSHPFPWIGVTSVSPRATNAALVEPGETRVDDKNRLSPLLRAAAVRAPLLGLEPDMGTDADATGEIRSDRLNILV
jgi:hypothetical protein